MRVIIAAILTWILLQLCASCAPVKPFTMRTDLDITYANGQRVTKKYAIHGMPNLDDFKPFKVHHGDIVFGTWYGERTLEKNVQSFKITKFSIEVK